MEVWEWRHPWAEKGCPASGVSKKGILQKVSGCQSKRRKPRQVKAGLPGAGQGAHGQVGRTPPDFLSDAGGHVL